jgi:WD40 repeat protein
MQQFNNKNGSTANTRTLQLHGHEGEVLGVDWSRNAHELKVASCSEDGSVRWWDLSQSAVDRQTDSLREEVHE